MIKNLFTVKRGVRLAVLSATVLVFTACNNSGSSSSGGGSGTTYGTVSSLSIMEPQVQTSNFYTAPGFFIIQNNTDKPVQNINYSLTGVSGGGSQSTINEASATACGLIAAHNECILYVGTPNTSGAGSYTLTVMDSKNKSDSINSNVVNITTGDFSNTSAGADGVSLRYDTKVVANQQYVVVTGLVNSSNAGKFNNAVLVDDAGNILPNQQAISGNLGNNLQYLRTGDTFAIAMPVPAGVGSTQNFKLQLNTLDENGNVSDIINGISTYAVTTVATAAEAQTANKSAVRFSQKSMTSTKVSLKDDPVPARVTAGLSSSTFSVTTTSPSVSNVLTITNNLTDSQNIELYFGGNPTIAGSKSFTLAGIRVNGSTACTITTIDRRQGGYIYRMNLEAGATCTLNMNFNATTMSPTSLTDAVLYLDYLNTRATTRVPFSYEVIQASASNPLSLSFDQGNGLFAANGSNIGGTFVYHVLTIQNMDITAQNISIPVTSLPNGVGFSFSTASGTDIIPCTVDTDGNVSGSLGANGTNTDKCSVALNYSYTGQSAITDHSLMVTDTTTSGNSNSINISTTYTPGTASIELSFDSPGTPFSASTDGSEAIKILTISNPNQDTQVVSLGTLPGGFSFDATATAKLATPCTLSENRISNMALSGGGQCQAVVTYGSTTVTSGVRTAAITASDSTNNTQSYLSLTYQVNQSTANLAISLPTTPGPDLLANVTNLIHLYSGILNNNNDSVKFIVNVTNSSSVAVTDPVTLSSGIDGLPITISNVSNGNNTTGCGISNIPKNGVCKVTLQLGPTNKVKGSYSFANATLDYNNRSSTVSYKLSNVFTGVANVNVISPNSAEFSVTVSSDKLGSGDGTQSKPYQINTGDKGTLTLTVKNVGTGTNATANSFYIDGQQLAGFDSTQSTCKTASTSNIAFAVGNTCTLVYKVEPKTSGLAKFDFGGLKYTYTADGSVKSSTMSQLVHINFVQPHKTYFVADKPEGCVPHGMTRPSDKVECVTIKGRNAGTIWCADGSKISPWFSENAPNDVIPSGCSTAYSSGWSLPSAPHAISSYMSSSNPGGDWGAIATAALANGYSTSGNLGEWMNNNGFKSITSNSYWSGQSNDDDFFVWAVGLYNGYVDLGYQYSNRGVLLVHS